MVDDLRNIYKEMLTEDKHKRDITSSTVNVVTKSQPRSPVVLDYEAELFGVSPEDIKRLPIKAIEMLQQALKHLIEATKKDPVLRQALRRMINSEFEEIEDDEFEKEHPSKKGKDDLKKESVILTYKDFLATLAEAVSLSQMDKLADTNPDTLNTGLYNRIVKELSIPDMKSVNPKNPIIRKVIQAVISTLIKDSKAVNLERYLMKIINYEPATEEIPTEG